MKKNITRKSDFIKQEARFLRTLKLSPESLEVLMGERPGTKKEKEKLRKISRAIGADIYKEAVYLMTHFITQNNEEAKKIYDDIIQHRNIMVKLLNRNVTVQVAALDYMQNIRNIIKRPTIMEFDKCREFTKRAFTDETTNTFDKDFLDADLETEIERARRFNSTLSVLFIDIDDLKKINDAHGHEVGTDAIKCVSNSIKKNLRKYDSVYRYGGDEFVVLLPRTDSGGALQIANRIKAKIAEDAGNRLPVSPCVSIGIADYGSNGIKGKKDLLVAADTALYKAKSKGKNTVCIFGEEPAQKSEKIEVTGLRLKPAPTAIGRSCKVKGIPLVPGYAMGQAYHYRDIMSRELETRDLEEHEILTEFSRIQLAVENARHDIRILREKAQLHLDHDHARIFDVHDMLLDDTALFEEIEKELHSKMLSAEQTVFNIFHQMERKFRTSDSTVLQDRAIDVQDIRRRVLRKLTGAEENPLESVPPHSVVFTKRLMPSDTIHLREKGVAAIVTEEGGASSHAAIIARALGIPSITNVSFNMEDIPEGSNLLVDGCQGIITVNPTPGESSRFLTKVKSRKKLENALLRKTLHKKLEIKGKPVFVGANVSSEEDLAHAQKQGCDCIGLFRIESLYMQTSTLPDQKELYNKLRRLLLPLQDKQITVRLTDMGGDKIVPYLKEIKDYDSALGLRGVRLLFHYPELLEPQVRAILQLSQDFNLRILVPMASLPDDMVKIRKILQEEKQKLKKDGIQFDTNIKVGAMIETPSAVITLNDIMAHSDFLSIGTNDLIQYVMAADRERLSVSEYYERGNELVLEMIGNILNAADEQNMGCSVCGELAGDERFTQKLIGLGLRHFSVLPPLIPKIKNKIYESFHK